MSIKNRKGRGNSRHDGGIGMINSEHTAWEPILKPEQKEGTCGSCRHLERRYAYLTAPLQYDCKITGNSHFEKDECDVPYLMCVEEEE